MPSLIYLSQIGAAALPFRAVANSEQSSENAVKARRTSLGRDEMRGSTRNEVHRKAGNVGATVVDLAVDVLDEVGTLVRAEFQLLRAEITEKIAFSGMYAGLLAAGALLLMATIVLFLQAAIAALTAYGISPPIAVLVVAVAALLTGALLVWLGVQGLSPRRLTPSKTVRQVQKDAALAKRH